MIHLPRSSYTTKPWKNGLGVTEEIFVYPKGSNDFDFRISMAALSTSGPFSVFPGIDRTLVLLEGKPILLNDLLVPLLSPVNFPGEDKMIATVESEGRDLNLMCKRGKASGSIEVLESAAVFPPDYDICVVFALSDSVSVGSIDLRRYDSCILQNEDRNLQIQGDKFMIIKIRSSHS